MTIQILKTEAELRLWRESQSRDIHFVPTMGSLHNGHLQLIKQAKALGGENNPIVLTSIFVNPLQFGPNEDFDKYPQNLSQDCLLAERAGANMIWAPRNEDILPKGLNGHFQLKAPKNLQAYLCGGLRKGHFDGVASILMRLLIVIKPKILVLGEKDWQQFIIIRELINQLELPIKLYGVATVRDLDGLALSSRNNFLNKSDRKKANHLPKVLRKARKMICEEEEHKPDLRKIAASLKEEGLTVKYIELVDPFLLQPVKTCKNLSLLAASVECGGTRLIDHCFLMKREPIVAIDGPAGAGKSTVTKLLAKKLGLVYLDTGAMYRAVTWLFKQECIDSENLNDVERILKDLNLNIQSSKQGRQTISINNHDVTDEIRHPIISSLVSKIATIPLVRKTLTEQQKRMGKRGGIVAEGRDIGTYVFPDAELKIFLTASSLERAKRRSIDLKERGFNISSIEEIEKEIIERDRIDSSRKVSPLTKADDALEVITDGMDIEQVVDAIAELFRLKIPQEVWPSNPH